MATLERVIIMKMSSLSKVHVCFISRIDDNIKTDYIEIDNNYPTAKKLVGGCVDCLVYGHINSDVDLCLVCNDEGKLLLLKPVLYVTSEFFEDIISGNCFLVFAKRWSREFLDLPRVYYDKIIENMTHNNLAYFDNNCRLPCLDLNWLNR